MIRGVGAWLRITAVRCRSPVSGRDTVHQAMAARTKSKVTPKYKTKYRVRNWSTYEAALRNRGDITVWFDEAAMGAWNASPSGRAGGQRAYSDVAILTALTLRSGVGARLSLTAARPVAEPTFRRGTQ